MGKKAKTKMVIIFILLNLISPWFWVLVKNPMDFVISKNQLYQISNERRLYEVNTFRGEATQHGFGLLGKLTVNKFTWVFKEILARAEESFDSYFLFFKGDLNVKRSTWVFGPVLWVLLPMALAGFLTLTKSRKRMVICSVIFFAFLGSFFEQHYFSPPKIPLFILFNWLATYGMMAFFSGKTKKSFKLLYLILVIFEVSRFIHDFYFHYPNRIASQ